MLDREKPDMNGEGVSHDIIDLVGNKLVARILWNRGYKTLEDASAFLYPDQYIPADPSVLPGLDDAVEIVAASLASGERVCVYGDYDVDGVSSTALLVRVLRSLGADVVYHVPNRFTEGYGLNGDVIRGMVECGCRLLLTCDCGIGSHDEIGLAKDLGMRVVVTDHHSIPEKPVPADVVVNPKMLDHGHTCRDLPGVGVAHFLAISLCRRLGRSDDDRLSQLVALGIVADVVPLLKENRYLLQRGMASINSGTPLVGIAAMMKICNITEVNEEDIGFQIAPRLNAPGRTGSPDISVDLLLSDDPTDALELALRVDDANRLRRRLVESVMDSLEGTQAEGSLVLFNENWHQGIIGIAAGRLTDVNNVPAVLMTLKDDGVTVVGSARSIEGINIYESLARVDRYLTKYGGHTGAAGFSLQREDLESFCQALKAELDHGLGVTEEGWTDVDAEISFRSIDLESYRRLRLLAPFGEGNPSPRFLTTAARIDTCRSIGGGRHQRLVLRQDDTAQAAIWWWNSQAPDEGMLTDIIYTLNCNTYNGTTGIQLVIERLTASEELVETRPIRIQLEVLDMRYVPGAQIPEISQSDACLFREGIKVAKAEANRYSVRVCDTLVLTTVPAHLTVLKEMMAIANCYRLVLAYPTVVVESPFIKRLMSVLKHLSEHGCTTTLECLASSTGELEITVVLGLRVLRESGYLEWESAESKIQFSLLNGKRIDAGTADYMRMSQVAAETRAFKYFMFTSRIEAISALLNVD